MAARTPRAESPRRPDDCFEAARQGYTLKLTCWACGHESVLHPAALWWHFHRRRIPDTLRILRQRSACARCREDRHQRITNPAVQLVHDRVTAEPLPLPSEADWKRELERRRR